jgi:methionyl-tRNA synthetase
LPRGLQIVPPDVLFKKIEDEQLAEWGARFGGGG